MAKDKGSTITPRGEDFAAWYQDVIKHGDLAEPAEVVKGCMVIKPHGYAVWEKIQADLDRRFKETGHKNAYFPLLIPESFLKKEAEHVEGFSPELAVVTIAGGKKLEEPYVIRPTSETIIGHFFGRWISSWRDLPLKINQWANVMRWELRTRMFLRTGEFLWQEGHTAHASHEESLAETLQMLDVYADFAEEVMAMPVIKGVKTEAEKFAGALRSYCIEAMMQNGYALQAGTSHDLGQNFGKAFDVTFQNDNKQLEYVWQTSWGVSTRLIGGLIMTHSDDNGLLLPPKLAPVHAVLVPIYRKAHEREQVVSKAQALAAELRTVELEGGGRLGVEVDDREGIKPGAKYFHWERLGACIRIEIGPRDIADQAVMLKRRDHADKQKVPMTELAGKAKALLDSMQSELLAAAKKRREDATCVANSYDEVKAILGDVTAERGGGMFVMAHIKDDPECDAKLKEIKASVRCIPLEDHYDGPGTCILTGEEVEKRSVLGKAY
ncbi:MAG: proline--tRNA ligase [Proteobacteria bacterium]|nr:MAG: proline--tRNA ligase [Pseudomonadota bacterium]